MTSVTMFSGGGLADVGLTAAGYTPIGACEHDPKIAAIYALNIGPHIEVGDVRGVDPSKWAGADLLWASPPCQAHSVARSKSLAPREDADVGLDVLRWVRAIGPRVVIIENVPGYVKHPAFAAIVAGLSAMGYGVRWDVVDFADMGVPQNRTRVILRAERDAILLPMLPAAVPWKGWYQAVEDLIPTFPESKFAPWQLKRLPELGGTFLLSGGNTSDVQAAPGVGVDFAHEPSHCVSTNVNQRAFLVEGAASGDRPPNVRGTDDPCFALTCPGDGREHRAFLVGGGSAGRDIPVAPGDEPSITVKANSGGKEPFRAYLVGVNGGSLPSRAGEGSSPAIASSHSAGKMRAFLAVTSKSGTDGLNTAMAGSPSVAVTNQMAKHPVRAWLDCGRVVALTPRAIARLQTVPDWYVLPDTKTLAGTVLGNGVPCLGAEKIARVHLEATR